MGRGKAPSASDAPFIKQSAAAYAAKDWPGVIAATHRCTNALSAAMQTRYDRAWRKLNFLGQRLHGINYSFQYLAVSPAGTWVAAGDREGHIWVWRLTWPFPSSFYSQGHPDTTHSVDLDGQLISLGFLDENTLLAVMANDNHLCWFDLATGNPTRKSLFNDGSTLSNAAFSHDSNKLYCVYSRDLLVVDGHSGDILRRETMPTDSWGWYDVFFSDDEKILIARDHSQRVTVWDSASRQILGAVVEDEDELIHCMAIDPKAKYLAIARRQELVELYRLPEATALPKIPYSKEVDWSYSVVFSPNSRFVVSSKVHGWHVAIWDAPSGTMRTKLFGGNCSRLALSKNGRVLVAGGETPGIHDKEKMTVYAWDIPEGVFADY